MSTFKSGPINWEPLNHEEKKKLAKKKRGEENQDIRVLVASHTSILDITDEMRNYINAFVAPAIFSPLTHH